MSTPQPASVSDLHVRELWTEGSLCVIYSRSKQSWFSGKIISIFHDQEGEWLKVRYNNTHCKHIQRLCKDIKPKHIHLKYTNCKDISLSQYMDHKKIFDKVLICGFVRSMLSSEEFRSSGYTGFTCALRLQKHQAIPAVIMELICTLYHTKMDITEFEFEKTLGTGTFGTVALRKHKQTTTQYAIKTLDKQRITEMKQEHHSRNEQKILSEIHHPFIVRFVLSFEDLHCIYFVFEVLTMGCEFFDLLSTYHRLNITQCVFYAAQIVLIFEYLHSKHIIYRDMKPENLMYTNDGYLKLIDFGFSKKLDETTNYYTNTLCGTPEYLSPEMILNTQHSFGVDWWALGILIFEMYTGFTPFECDHIVSVYANIMNHNQRNEGHILQYLNDDNLRDIVSKLLRKNAKQRLGSMSFNHVDDVKSHPFFSIIDWNKIYRKQYTNTPKHSPMTSPFPLYPLRDLNELNHGEKYQNLDDDPFLYNF